MQPAVVIKPGGGRKMHRTTPARPVIRGVEKTGKFPASDFRWRCNYESTWRSLPRAANQAGGMRKAAIPGDQEERTVLSASVSPGGKFVIKQLLRLCERLLATY